MLDYSIDGIQLQIARRVGDPQGDTYKDRALDYFLQSLSMIIANKQECNDEEVPILITESSISFNNKFGEVLIRNIFPSVIQIKEIYNTDYLIGYIKLSRISIEEYIDIMSNKQRLPGNYEGYYCITGGKIKYIFGKDVSSNTFICSAIVSPSSYSYEKYDLVTELNFGERLILKAVDYAVKMLKQEISME